jgi:hypothetical protein
MEKKILVSDGAFLECVEELATQITEMNFGAETWEEKKCEEQSIFFFSEEAQDFFNEKIEEYEALINNTLNVWNKQAE